MICMHLYDDVMQVGTPESQDEGVSLSETEKKEEPVKEVAISIPGSTTGYHSPPDFLDIQKE